MHVASVDFLLEAAIAGWTVRFRLPARVSRAVAEPAPSPSPTPAPTASATPSVAAVPASMDSPAAAKLANATNASHPAEPSSAEALPLSGTAVKTGATSEEPRASPPSADAESGPAEPASESADGANRPSRARGLSAASPPSSPPSHSPRPRSARIAGRAAPGDQGQGEPRRLAAAVTRSTRPTSPTSSAGAVWRAAFVAVAQARREDDAPLTGPRPDRDRDWMSDPVGVAVAWLAGPGAAGQLPTRPGPEAAARAGGGSEALEQLLTSAWRGAIRATPGVGGRGCPRCCCGC